MVLMLNGRDLDPADLFRQYAAAFKGRRLLTWSRGLEKRLGEFGYTRKNREDYDIASDDAKREALMLEMGLLDREKLAVLVSRSALGEFHRYVQTCCTDLESSQQDIDDFIESTRRRPAKGSGLVFFRIRSGFPELRGLQVDERTRHVHRAPVVEAA